MLSLSSYSCFLFMSIDEIGSAFPRKVSVTYVSRIDLRVRIPVSDTRLNGLGRDSIGEVGVLKRSWRSAILLIFRA